MFQCYRCEHCKGLGKDYEIDCAIRGTINLKLDYNIVSQCGTFKPDKKHNVYVVLKSGYAIAIQDDDLKTEDDLAILLENMNDSLFIKLGAMYLKSSEIAACSFMD